MKMKINEQLICIPPYVSTRWAQVAFIQTEEEPESKTQCLLLHLVNGKIIKIPHLEKAVIDIAFCEHLRHLEQSSQRDLMDLREGDKLKPLVNLLTQVTKTTDLQFFSSKNMFPTLLFGGEGLESLLQHIPEQKDCPNVPSDLLDKMINIMKMLAGGELKSLLKPEPHCNCLHCQIGRSINETTEEEVITEDDLSFRSWDIIQSGDKLYTVTNPLDNKEQYNVYLGNPVGCTCGNEHCEHIKAVLHN